MTERRKARILANSASEIALTISPNLSQTPHALATLPVSSLSVVWLVLLGHVAAGPRCGRSPCGVVGSSWLGLVGCRAGRGCRGCGRSSISR